MKLSKPQEAMLRIILLILCLIPQSAFALNITPPAAYRDPALQRVPVRVTFLTLTQLQRTCKNKAFPLITAYGCAFTLSEACLVFVIDRPHWNVAFPLGRPIITPAQSLDHELAHCAGWPPHHPRS